ncbi:hypothetical protein GCM10010329_49860 [Streptomyces spiroverticillatus]|uniref:Uncharacterized protein n=1 Tax=Streptomyces finlayi TaxID=67296 RepID=A0A918X1D6_9ACTN|nr:hypothetical protein [Streptomyces finlayi]GHA20535.1 hypothetical protein GCM10010329_49860 [Streptomyces spiroverticillatus]GHD03265.1 hypothetical protein GCM10010334_50810 [Streptomyces finlayi]
MGHAHGHLPSTEAAVVAIREVAREYGREVTVTDDIGTDQVTRRTDAGVFATTDAGGGLPHDAFVEIVGGTPAVAVQLYADGDARFVIDGVEVPDVPRDSVPAFLRSVYGGLAYVKGRFFPPGYFLVVPLPGDETYKEMVPSNLLSPWMAGRVR